MPVGIALFTLKVPKSYSPDHDQVPVLGLIQFLTNNAWKRALAGNYSDGFPMTMQKPMTLQEAKSIARHLGLTLRKVRSGDYRVNFRDGDETTAHYTDNLEDAVNTAVEMARKRDYERRTVQSRSVI